MCDRVRVDNFLSSFFCFHQTSKKRDAHWTWSHRNRLTNSRILKKMTMGICHRSMLMLWLTLGLLATVPCDSTSRSPAFPLDGRYIGQGNWISHLMKQRQSSVGKRYFAMDRVSRDVLCLQRGGSSEAPVPKKRPLFLGRLGISKNNTSSPETKPQEEQEQKSPNPPQESPKEKRRRQSPVGNETDSKPDEKKREGSKANKNNKTSPTSSSGNTTVTEGGKKPSTQVPDQTTVTVAPPPPTYHLVRGQPNMIRPAPPASEKNALIVEVLSRLLTRAVFVVWSWRWFFGHDKIVPVQHFVW